MNFIRNRFFGGVLSNRVFECRRLISVTNENKFGILKLRPSLLIDYKEHPLITGHKRIDDIVENRLLEDKTNVRGIIHGDHHNISIRVHDLHYVSPLFILKICRNDEKPLVYEDAEIIDLNIVDPDDAGPDTWMEEDIIILDDNDDLPEHLIGKSIELIVRVESLETLNGDLIYRP